jgi:DNA mismatch repair protein MutL
MVKDMQWALERAFEYLLPRGRFPVLILHFTLPGELLDVNVHPGKLEIRINDPDLNPAITRALRTAISGGQRMPDLGGAGSALRGTRDGGRQSGWAGGGADSRAGSGYGDNAGGTGANESGGVAGGVGTSGSGGGQRWAGPPGGAGYGEPVRQWETLFTITRDGEKELDELIRGWDLADGGAGSSPASGFEASQPLGGAPFGPTYDQAADDRFAPELPLDSLLVNPEEKARSLQRSQWGVESHTKALRDMAGAGLPEDFQFGPQAHFLVIGQLHRTFILAEVNAGLLVVDQHVAHERIIYDALDAKTKDKQDAQMLMQPIQFDLTTAEEEVLVRKIMLLNDLGLIFERFGPRQYLLRSEPAGHSMDQAMVHELLEAIGSEGEAAGADSTRQALLVLNSCKAAVKANTALTFAEMTALLKNLRQTAHPMTCPHGRPIMYLLPYRRLLQAFGRSS